MAPDLPTTAPGATTTWPVLTTNERRVLGVLVEKAKTTPDVYPLSMNSLVTGSNQKSNRDPVLELTDLDIEEALVSAQKQGLVIKITGGRVERWRHHLYEAWHVDKVELAILAELLLRGPQTEGELRGRASRMEPIADLDTLRGLLRQLAERRLVVFLTPESRRGTLVTHGFHSPEELKRLRDSAPAEEEYRTPPPVPNRETASNPAPAAPASGAPLTALEASVGAMKTELADLRQVVDNLRATVTEVKAQLQSLREALGS
jgi:uncharacterized protein YceH (UPF0502 family)